MDDDELHGVRDHNSGGFTSHASHQYLFNETGMLTVQYSPWLLWLKLMLWLVWLMIKNNDYWENVLSKHVMFCRMYELWSVNWTQSLAYGLWWAVEWRRSTRTSSCRATCSSSRARRSHRLRRRAMGRVAAVKATRTRREEADGRSRATRCSWAAPASSTRVSSLVSAPMYLYSIYKYLYIRKCGKDELRTLCIQQVKRSGFESGATGFAWRDFRG